MCSFFPKVLIKFSSKNEQKNSPFGLLHAKIRFHMWDSLA